MKTGGLSLDQAPAEDIPLRFFISAPIFGILAGLMVLLKGNFMFFNTWMPETVALTHLLHPGVDGLGDVWCSLSDDTGTGGRDRSFSKTIADVTHHTDSCHPADGFWFFLESLMDVESFTNSALSYHFAIPSAVGPTSRPCKRKSCCGACYAVCSDLPGLDPSAGFHESGPVCRVVAGLPGPQPFENPPFADGPSGMDRLCNLRGRISCHPNVLPLKTFFG